MQKQPRVGMGIFIIKDGKVLLGKRLSLHGTATWCPPGGHLEFQETWEQCAKRETEEEAGIKVDNVRFLAVTNDFFNKTEKHYVTIHMIADLISGKPRTTEPDKIAEWGWFSWDNLPQPLFTPVQNLVDSGYNPFKDEKELQSPSHEPQSSI